MSQTESKPTESESPPADCPDEVVVRIDPRDAAHLTVGTHWLVSPPSLEARWEGAAAVTLEPFVKGT